MPRTHLDHSLVPKNSVKNFDFFDLRKNIFPSLFSIEFPGARVPPPCDFKAPKIQKKKMIFWGPVSGLDVFGVSNNGIWATFSKS